MASKWAKLRGKYAALPYDEALRQAADDLMDLEPGDLVERYNELDEEIDELNERVKGLTFARAAAERALITRMDAIGTDRLDMGGYSWSVTYEPYAQAKDRKALRVWMEAHEPDLLTVNPQTLKGLVKDALERDVDIPDGVEVFLKSGLSRRKRG
jgi:hypothetical protein